MTSLLSTEQTVLQKARELKLPGFAAAVEEQLTDPASYGLVPCIERIDLALQREIDLRKDRAYQSRLKRANLPYNTTIADIPQLGIQGIPESCYGELLGVGWVRNSVNICLTGPTGTGKSSTACALGRAAIVAGLTVEFYEAAALLGQLSQLGAQERASRIKKLTKVNVLILDNLLGLETGMNQAESLYYLLDERCKLKGKMPTAVVVTSQIKAERFTAALEAYSKGKDKGFAQHTIEGAVDRLLNPSQKFVLTGESLRKRISNDIS